MRLNDPELVRREYADESVFRVRNRVFTDLVEGVNAQDVALEAVHEIFPGRVLEVGSGLGDFSERILREVGAKVVAVDLSPRMVELTGARGIDARLGDVADLPFADGEFDCVVANWMLYHVPDLDRGLAEIARVLRGGGRLVAATFGEENLRELWELVGRGPSDEHPFSSENGFQALSRHFASVERRDARATVIFPDRATLVEYVAASIRRRHLADRVPDEIALPLRARSAQTVFVAEKAP